MPPAINRTDGSSCRPGPYGPSMLSTRSVRGFAKDPINSCKRPVKVSAIFPGPSMLLIKRLWDSSNGDEAKEKGCHSTVLSCGQLIQQNMPGECCRLLPSHLK